MSDEYNQRQLIRPLPTNLPGAPLPAEAAASSADGLNLQDYLKVVHKYHLVIAASTIVAVVFALIYAFTVTPRYTAQSKIRISTYEPILTATKIEDVLKQKSQEANYLETQIQEVRSYSLADKVLKDEAVHSALFAEEKSGWFSSLFSSNDKTAEQVPDQIEDISGYSASITEIKSYLGAIRVNPVRRTSLVGIEVTLDDPKLAALVANKHALAYIECSSA